MTSKHLGLPVIFILMISFFAHTAGALSYESYEIPLMEGEFAEVGSGYYLNVLDVDTYSGTVRLAVTYYGNVYSDAYYSAGDRFYYEDETIRLEFDISDTYTADYTDYILISNINKYPSDPSSGYTEVITQSSMEDAESYGEYYSDDSSNDYHSNDIYYDDPRSDNGPLSTIIPLLAILLFPFLILRKAVRKRKGKDGAKQGLEDRAPPKATPPPANRSSAPVVPAPAAMPGDVVIKSAVQYKGANILYKVKVENPSQEPVGDIKVSLFVPDVFRLKETDRTISMLQPGEGKTVTFEIRPTGECGNCIISGSIRYYDYSKKKHIQLDLNERMVDIVCPILRAKVVDEESWRQQTGAMLIAEEDTKDLEIPAENLFGIATRILRDMNLYMIEPEVTSTQQLFTGVARFYAEGVSGLRYAAYVEVVGKRRSCLMIRAWAEKEEALTGFYHKIREEIEKRTDVNLFVDDSVTNYNINNTTIQDSVIQRSSIGSNNRKCPNCGHEVKSGERFCMNCGERLSD